MSSSRTHYEILGVSQEASPKEIKKAFYQKVREHPPEQDAKAYSRIRKAYDVLSNPVARNEYNSMAQYGDKIKALETEAEALLDDDPPKTKQAIRKLRKAIVLGPEIGLLRNMLGNAYMLDQSHEKALAQYERAASIDPENQSYQVHKGFAYHRLERLSDAEAVLRDVWEADPGDYESARALASVLFDQSRIQDAHEVLDAAIYDDGAVDFEDFFCYYDKLHYFLYDGETSKLSAVLDTVKSLPETEDDRLFASFTLGKIGAQLYEVNAYDIADQFLTAARELDPENENLESFAEANESMNALGKQVDAVLEFERAPDLIKHIVVLGWDILIGEIDEATYDTRLQKAVQMLEETIYTDPLCSDAKHTARRIKRTYDEVYKLNSGLYDTIIDLPKATHISKECPYCDAFITVHKRHDYRHGHCPTCGNAIHFDGETFSKAGSY